MASITTQFSGNVTTWTDGLRQIYTVSDNQSTSQVSTETDITGKISTVRCDARIEPGIKPHVTVISHTEGSRVTLMVGRFNLTMSKDTAKTLHEELGKTLAEGSQVLNG